MAAMPRLSALLLGRNGMSSSATTFTTVGTLKGEIAFRFGSDYPHTDGLAEPVTFTESLTSFDQDGVRKIMHDNAHGLFSPRAAR